jgi:putative FmdB family regulatory protein
MPIYEYRCKQCDHCFEALILSSSDECTLHCPQCDCEEIDKMLSLFSRACGSKEASSSSCAPSGGGFS